MNKNTQKRAMKMYVPSFLEVEGGRVESSQRYYILLPSRINTFNNYVFSTYYSLSSVLDTGSSVNNKTDLVSVFTAHCGIQIGLGPPQSQMCLIFNSEHSDKWWLVATPS